MGKNRFAKVVSVILVWLMVSSTLGAFPSVVYAATFNIGDTVEVTENLNVRTGPGTTYPEITDHDYIDYAPTGTRGTVLDGPTSANGYVWWKVDYGPGLYSGWSVEGGLEKVIQPPPAPVITSPGSASEPGTVLSTLTPTLQWNAVSGADYYALAISKYPYGSGNIIYNPQQVTSTSHVVPGGTLVAGEKYRWNMQAHNSAGWSVVSNTLYFQTQTTTYTLTVSIQGQGTVSPSGGSYASGTQVTLTATPASGWQFSGWSGDLSSGQNPVTITMNSNKNITATFTQQSTPLSFTSLTPGTISTSQSTYVATLSAVGTNFNNVNQITVSWSGPDSGSQTWNKGDSNWNAAVTVNSDTSMTLLVRVLSNETGTQTKIWTWTVTLKDTASVTASKSFTVTYTPAGPYTLTVSIQGQGTVSLSPSGGSYASGTQVTLTATPTSGWLFSGWSGDLSGSQNPAIITMNSNKSVTATFTQQVSPPPAPTITSPGSASEPGTVLSNLTPTLQWNAVSGADYYALAISKYPYGSGNIIYNPQQLTGTSHVVPGGTLIAGEKYRWNMQAHNSAGWSAVSNTLYFQAPPPPSGPYTLTVTVQGQGTVSPSGGSYASGTQVSLTATPASGWQFSAWSGDLTGSQNPATITMNSNKSITTTFTQTTTLPAPNLGSPANSATGVSTTPTFSWSAVSGATSYRILVGTTSAGLPTDPTADTGSNLVINDTPTGTSYTPASGVLSAGTTYYWEVHARSPTQYGTWSSKWSFTTQTGAYTLTVSIQGQGTVSPSGGSYASGTQVTLTATPASGWLFSSWSGDLTGSQNPATITMNSHKSVTATFTKQATPLSFTSLTPYTITTNTAPYDATLSANGTNFSNVDRVTFTWSGAASGTATWDKGGSDWNNKVTVSSDTSMTLRPRVVETSSTWSGTVTWEVTLRDTTGVTASRSFTVTYTLPYTTVPDYPSAQWVPAHPNNYTVSDRGAGGIHYIVVHAMYGYLNGTIDWFQDPNNPYLTSAHYLVGQAGEVVQMVKENDIAHHATVYNEESIGIEYEDSQKYLSEPWTSEAMYQASAKLVRYLTEKYSIPRDRTHIIGHNEVPGSGKQDPGQYWDWDYFMALVITGQPPDTSNPVVNSLSVTPATVTLGNSFTITFSATDSGGSGLKQVELWRANDSAGSPGTWAQVTSRSVSGNSYSGSFTDAPSSGGSYWYGIHAVDNAGSWNDERNSRTDSSPGVYGPIMVEVKQAQETISTPNTPTGPSSSQANQGLAYSTGGASSGLGHSLEYRFDWGDGSYSNWSPSTSASHSWSTQDTYTVKAQARCALHTSIISDWSPGLSVSVKLPTGTVEITSEPSGASFTLSGPQDYSGTTPWRKTDAPIGTYAVTWGFMSGYETPPRESKALTQGETASFFGHYKTSNILVRLLSTDVNPSGSGSVRLDPSGGTYDEGTQVTLATSPALGYTFDHWGGDASGTGSSVTITMDSDKSVTAYFTAVPPLISVSPATLSFEAVQSDENPPTKTIAIWNAGGGMLDWEVSSEATWLNFNQTSGSSTGETDKIVLSVDIAGMVDGDYNSTMTISSIETTNIRRIVPVSLSVRSQPVASALSDLTITLVDAPSEGIVGQNISVTFVVENRDNDASGPFHSIVALSPESNPWGTEMYLSDITMNSIPPDDLKRVTVDVTVPPSISSPSDYYVTVFADAFEKVLESNEGNNIGSTYPKKIAISSGTSTLADIIADNAIGGIPVIVDGQLYIILTLKNRIDPITLEVVPDSGPTKIYVYGDKNYPVSDKGIVSKIGLIDLARESAKDFQQRRESLSQLLEISQEFEYVDLAYALSNTGKDILSDIKEVKTIIDAIDNLKVIQGAVNLKDIGKLEDLPIGWLVDGLIWLLKETIGNPMEEIKGDLEKDLFDALVYYNNAQKVLLRNQMNIEGYEDASEFLFHYWYGDSHLNVALELWQKILGNFMTVAILDSIEPVLGQITGGISDIGINFGQLIVEAKLATDWTWDATDARLTTKANAQNKLWPHKLHEAAPYTLELANNPRITWQVHSPVEVRAYDSQGRVTGTVNGEVRIEIPYSVYHENAVTIFSPTDSYDYELEGTGEGSYELTVTRIIGQEVNKFTTAEVPTSPGATHLLNVDWDALSRERDKLPIRVDSDGDGRFENIIYLSGLSAKGLPPWVWLTIGGVVGFAIAFGVLRRKPRRKDAKPWVKSFVPTKLRRIADKIVKFVSGRSKRFLVRVLLISKGVQTMIAKRRQPYIPPASGAGAPSHKLAPITASLSVAIPLAKPDILIGSGADSDIVIKHPSVADRHARIFQEVGRNVVDDLGSSTGTFVSYSGQPSQERKILAKNALKEGSYIRLGESAPIIFHAKPRSLVVKYSLRSDKSNTIGSDMSNDTVLREPSASRNHAQIVWEAETFAVKDLGSEHGTFIRYGGESSLERRITGKNAIKHGSIIRIGDTLLRIEVESMRGIP